MGARSQVNVPSNAQPSSIFSNPDKILVGKPHVKNHFGDTHVDVIIVTRQEINAWRINSGAFVKFDLLTLVNSPGIPLVGIPHLVDSTSRNARKVPINVVRF
jgi:hypothetical protein